MELQRREHRDPLTVPLDQGVDRVPAVLGDEGVDEHERVGRLVGDRADRRAPVGRTARLGLGLSLGMIRLPPVQAGAKLLDAHRREATSHV